MTAGGFLLFVGPAASGKSRCAYELARSMLADWPIFMPSTAKQVTDYFGTNPAPGRLVVWLNETQKFLGSDGLTSETVRHILALPWPVIIIGTIWPQSYDALIGAPGAELVKSTQDTREILTMLAQRKDLLPGFTEAELGRASSLAARDPRIAEALTEAAPPNLAETLAAAPDLISRWLNAADPFGAAVITAAVIARRCGHPEPLPAKVLEPLAEEVLTPAERSRVTPHWFTDALNWARVPVRGHAAPLTPYASTPGIVDGDQVSDVLVQHAIHDAAAPGHDIYAETWLLLIEHATPSACQHIADAADGFRYGYQFTVAETSIRKAAETEDGLAMANLAVLLREYGRTAEAEQWLHKAVEAGNSNAMLLLSGLFAEHGRAAEAKLWLRKGAGLGDREAMLFLGAVLAEEGRTAQAERWTRQAAEAGHTDAMFFLGSLLWKQGKSTEAEQWCRRAAEAGNDDGMLNLGVLLAERGKNAEAEEWYRRAAEAGNTRAMANLGIMLTERNEAEAEQWLRQAAVAGNPPAIAFLGTFLMNRGDSVEAEQWIRKASRPENVTVNAALDSLAKRTKHG
jgi:TPR repeat protein